MSKKGGKSERGERGTREEGINTHTPLGTHQRFDWAPTTFDSKKAHPLYMIRKTQGMQSFRVTVTGVARAEEEELQRNQ